MLIRLHSLAIRNRKASDGSSSNCKSKPFDSTALHKGDRPRLLSLEGFVSLGLGSDLDGSTLATLTCGNHMGRMPVAIHRRCSNKGTIPCLGCHLVKYCSERCQKQHWPQHSSSCANPYLDKSWQPRWIMENREPRFLASLSWFHNLVHTTPNPPHVLPALDVLRLSYNEGEGAKEQDFKICFISCTDIRNLVKTVNNLPKDYSGRCEIVLNDTDATVINRNLVVLFALLGAGPSLDEASELATHLMYSTALTPQCAEYVQRCVDYIYASDTSPKQQSVMSFRVRLATRGIGSTIYSTQTAMGVRQLMEMFHGHPSFTLSSAMKGMYCTTTQHDNADNWDWFMSKLTPPHRMSFKNYRETGILSPFSLYTTNFTHPNRLLFSPHGEWLGDYNPLRGWDISSVLSSGEKHGVDSADILGCLFFHVKSQLREFACRIKDLKVHIHLTQFDLKILSKGLLSGALGPRFEGGACFDRIDTGCLVEEVGIRECLAEWGPLLKKDNRCATILMSTRTWHEGLPGGYGSTLARSNPRVALASIMEKCFKIPGLHTKFKKSFAQGLRSPKLLRMIESLDAFCDHDQAFQEYLKAQNMNTPSDSEALGVELRRQHRVHPKRFGVPLQAREHQLPSLSRNEFYQLGTCLFGAPASPELVQVDPNYFSKATLCGVNFSARFMEFVPVLGSNEEKV
ncbi:hypothetical protein PM082_020986 [Marasmius tenuissimus]|nr:hypothetical protein PM082_020986 [Marasmius tenuissimus]